MFNLKSPMFLGGQNVHHLLMLILLGYIAYCVYMSKSKTLPVAPMTTPAE
tara:strand:+ start:1005 stop:1154 length:150 start_codon:yes stop_codon:yes gene_type:complete